MVVHLPCEMAYIGIESAANPSTVLGRPDGLTPSLLSRGTTSGQPKDLLEAQNHSLPARQHDDHRIPQRSDLERHERCAREGFGVLSGARGPYGEETRQHPFSAACQVATNGCVFFGGSPKSWLSFRRPLKKIPKTDTLQKDAPKFPRRRRRGALLGLLPAYSGLRPKNGYPKTHPSPPEEAGAFGWSTHPLPAFT